MANVMKPIVGDQSLDQKACDNNFYWGSLCFALGRYFYLRFAILVKNRQVCFTVK